jgi:hypothetical protein
MIVCDNDGGGAHDQPQETLFRIAAAAAAIERLDGVAQDVEGCLTADGRLWVVQSRPQV